MHSKKKNLMFCTQQSLNSLSSQLKQTVHTTTNYISFITKLWYIHSKEGPVSGSAASSTVCLLHIDTVAGFARLMKYCIHLHRIWIDFIPSIMNSETLLHLTLILSCAKAEFFPRGAQWIIVFHWGEVQRISSEI